MSSSTATDPREADRSIPKHARAAFSYKDGGSIEIKTDHPVVQPDELQHGQVLVHMLFSGVCHTDLHALMGDWPLKKKVPLCGGHEGTGIVVALGPGSDEYVKIGDRVGVKWVADACLSCEFCRIGEEGNCAKTAKLSGYTVDGTFAQYVVSWARYVTPIPKELHLADAAPILCAGITVYKALKHAHLIAGQSVVVLGAGGGLGHLCCQYAAASGLRVIAIDTGEQKRAFVLQDCGAEAFIDFRQHDDGRSLVQAVRAATPGGHGAHAAIVAASTAAAYEQAIAFLRPGGTLVAVGLPKTTMRLDIFSSVVKQVAVKGSYVGNRQDAVEALDIAARGKVKVFYKLRGLSEIGAVFDDMEQGKLIGRVVLDLDK